MAETIADADAITYAAHFYAAVADGQSIRSAHAVGQAALDLAGLGSPELPTLACAEGADPYTTKLVKAPGRTTTERSTRADECRSAP